MYVQVNLYHSFISIKIINPLPSIHQVIFVQVNNSHQHSCITSNLMKLASSNSYTILFYVQTNSSLKIIIYSNSILAPFAV